MTELANPLGGRVVARSGRRREAELISKTSTVWAAPALAIADVDAGQRPLRRGEGCKYRVQIISLCASSPSGV